MTISISTHQLLLMVCGILLLILSFLVQSEAASLGLLFMGMFSFGFAQLCRMEDRIDQIYEELMAYEIVEEGEDQ